MNHKYISKPFIDKISFTFYSHKSFSKKSISTIKLVDVEKLLVGEVECIHRETGRINSYRSMAWSKNDVEGTVAVKYGRFNKDGAVNYGYLQVEYNPTKTTLPTVLLDFIKQFEFHIIEINSIDIAWNLQHILVNDVLFTGNANSQIMSFGTLGLTATKYLHPKCNHGRIKVYDKYAERKALQRKYPTIDADKYQYITRCEITFHNVFYLLEPWYEQDEIIKIQDMFKYISQVMYKSRLNNPLTEDINKNDSFVIDAFVEMGKYDYVQTYIRGKGINQRKKLYDYVKDAYYLPLWQNDLSSQLRFAEHMKTEIYKLLPQYCFLSV